MNIVTTALIAGLLFGLIDVVLMIPIKFDTPAAKKEAMIAAFIERFGIGFVIPLVSLPIPHALTGIFISCIFSLPTAIITKSYAPVLGTGIIGGLIIGFLT